MMSFIKYFELAALLAAVLNIYTIRKNAFLLRLAVLVAVITVCEFAGYFLSRHYIPNLWYYNTIFIPVQFILYGYAFGAGLRKSHFRKLPLPVTSCFMLIYAISYYMIDPSKSFCNVGYCTGSIMVASYAIMYVAFLINRKEVIDFLKLPVVYLMLSMVLYYLITIPFYTAGYFYYRHYGTLLHILLNTMTILDYLLYTTFIFTFLWAKKNLTY
jgi:hypothetical protein